MVRLRFLGAVLVFMGVVGDLSAAENPDVKALRNEITALRAQEKALVKVLRAQYESVVKVDKLSEAQLIEARKVLSAQEKELLAVATTKEDRDAIRQQYSTLRDAIGNGVHLDATKIHELRTMENAQVKQISLAFKAKIQELEAAIKVAGKVSKPKGAKK
ncbi:MAG: hypothetical protein ACJ8FY_11080 [Gemmataceae bacterium]